MISEVFVMHHHRHQNSYKNTLGRKKSCHQVVAVIRKIVEGVAEKPQQLTNSTIDSIDVYSHILDNKLHKILEELLLLLGGYCAIVVVVQQYYGIVISKISLILLQKEYIEQFYFEKRSGGGGSEEEEEEQESAKVYPSLTDDHLAEKKILSYR